MSTIGFTRPTGKETTAELADMVASMQKVVEHLSRNVNTKNIPEIGGWAVDMDRLTSLDGDVGMSSAYSGLDDVRFWAGSTLPEMAPWRVLNSGKMYSTGAEIASNSGYPKVVMDPSSDLLGAYTSPVDYIQIFTRNSYPYMRYESGGVYTTYVYQQSTGFNITSSTDIKLTTTYGDVIPSSIRVTDWTSIKTGSTNLGSVLAAINTQISNLQSGLGSANESISTLQSSKSNVGHTHSVTLPDHNHGNPANVNSGGGTYTAY